MPYKEVITKSGDKCPADSWGQYTSTLNSLAKIRLTFKNQHPLASEFTKAQWRTKFGGQNGHTLSSEALFYVWSDEPESNEWGEVSP